MKHHRLTRLSQLLFGVPFALLAQAASAATAIGSGSTTVATSTANNGAADDITVSGTRTISSAGTAITLDSSNSVTLSGTITGSDVSDATGVAILGGNTGSFLSGGTINLTSTYSASDTNSDGVTEAPFTSGSNRYGIHVYGSSSFAGSISLSSTSSISVRGADSYGVLTESRVAGDISNVGAISIVGANSTALAIHGSVGGNIASYGAISATGENAAAISLTGAVDGHFSLYSTTTATGYSSTSRSSTASTLSKIQATSSEVQQSAGAVIIAGDVSGGVFLAAAPVGTASGSTADLDGDGVADGSEGSSVITNYGFAPALLVGSSSSDITLGAFGTGDNAYGLINRGSIYGYGIYDGISATALQIGGAGGAVNIVGGVRNAGTIAATAYKADATAILAGAGAVIPTLQNESTITATIAAPTAGVTSPITDTGDYSATAIEIAGGASVSKLVNLGTITAKANGDATNAVAVIDHSGSLSTVLNEGEVTASTVASTSGAAATGKTVAFDLSANTTGVTFIQKANSSPATNLTTGVKIQPATPSITGDIYLGSGDNVVEFLAGTVDGALSLGSGAASLTIDGGAIYEGALSYTGSALTLNVTNGALLNTNAATYQAASLNIGSSGKVSFALDPANNSNTKFNVSGAAVIDSGATISTSVLSRLTGSQSFEIINAGSLSADASAINLQLLAPYFYETRLSADQSAGTLNVDIRRRTATEAGVSAAEAGAFDAVYASTFQDSDILTTFSAATSKSGFERTYKQMLPEHSGGVFLAAAKGAEAIRRATQAYVDSSDELDSKGVWLKQVAFGVRNSGSDNTQISAGGFGVAAGFEGPELFSGRLNYQADFYAASVKSPDLPANTKTDVSVIEAGLGWRKTSGPWSADAGVRAGLLDLKSVRAFNVTDASGDYSGQLQATGKTSGYTLSADFNLGYQLDLGEAFYLRPQVAAAYFQLSQDGYSETGGGDGLNLSIDSRDGHEYKTSALFELGKKTPLGWGLRPRVTFGVEDVFSSDAGSTTATTFTIDLMSLNPYDINGPRGTLRFSLSSQSDWASFDLEVGGETSGDYTGADARVSTRFLF